MPRTSGFPPAANQKRRLSYSAVVTTLGRLHEKDAVTRARDGPAFRYVAVVNPSALVAWRMRRLLDTDADHASVLRRFVSSLTKQDEETLRRLLSDPDQT
ncbi:hypothetical protein GCM10011576_24570 [Micromonospora parathelypteridis]|nr:hypothetical protein GCM10011576_24570 [Micromonospora parathelypteridis]